MKRPMGFLVFLLHQIQAMPAKDKNGDSDNKKGNADSMQDGCRTAFSSQLVVNAKPRARERIDPAKHAKAAMAPTWLDGALFAFRS